MTVSCERGCGLKARSTVHRTTVNLSLSINLTCCLILINPTFFACLLHQPTADFVSSASHCVLKPSTSKLVLQNYLLQYHFGQFLTIKRCLERKSPLTQFVNVYGQQNCNSIAVHNNTTKSQGFGFAMLKQNVANHLHVVLHRSALYASGHLECVKNDQSQVTGKATS